MATPLHRAVISMSEAVVLKLLNNGANIEAKDYRGATTLHWATYWRKKLAIMQVLLDRGADLEYKTIIKRTALHLAASRKWGSSNLKSLISNGADIEAIDDDRRTALHLAVKLGEFASIQALIESGASWCAQDSGGPTPLDLMSEDLLTAILDNQPSLFQNLHNHYRQQMHKAKSIQRILQSLSKSENSNAPIL